MDLLPEDVVADVLRRVAPRGLAACRCVCKALRATIDARRLLRADLLPLSVGGIFFNFKALDTPEFFSRPTLGPTISGTLDYLPSFKGDTTKILDHCNGLLLLRDYVVNPATRQWQYLPPCPPVVLENQGLLPGSINHDETSSTSREPASQSNFSACSPVFTEESRDFTYEEYLVFDPAVSPDYEVYIIPRLRYYVPRNIYGKKLEHNLDHMMEQSEWPPSRLALHVFSSRSGCWEERSFIRQGKAAGDVADMRLPHWEDEHKKRYAVYWSGALYVHCEADFVMRISLSDGTYKSIKPLSDMGSTYCQGLHLGRSKNGVHLASVRLSSRLLVWLLEESCGQASWVLKHDIYLTPMRQNPDYYLPVLGPWVLQDINFDNALKYYRARSEEDECMEYLIQKKLELNSNKEEVVEEKYEWDSEEDDVLDQKDVVDKFGYGCVDVLGFHPYKEIVFLNVSEKRVLACHLKDSKAQDLGYMYPTLYYEVMSCEQSITESFPYTPCWI